MMLEKVGLYHSQSVDDAYPHLCPCVTYRGLTTNTLYCPIMHFGAYPNMPKFVKCPTINFRRHGDSVSQIFYTVQNHKRRYLRGLSKGLWKVSLKYSLVLLTENPQKNLDLISRNLKHILAQLLRRRERMSKREGKKERRKETTRQFSHGDVK